jgi:hypothetical protein
MIVKAKVEVIIRDKSGNIKSREVAENKPEENKYGIGLY